MTPDATHGVNQKRNLPVIEDSLQIYPPAWGFSRLALAADCLLIADGRLATTERHGIT